MDVFVLTSTLGVLVPLGRMLDHGMPQAWAWTLAGLAAGLGFAAKGPVAWVIPGIAFFGYVAWHRVGRSIPACETPQELVRVWRQPGRVFLLVEDDGLDKVRAVLGNMPPVLEHRFASRVAYLFRNQAPARAKGRRRRIAP